MIYWMNPKNYDNRISIEESIQTVLRIIQNTVTEMMNPNKNNTIYNSFSKLVYNNYENRNLHSLDGI